MTCPRPIQIIENTRDGLVVRDIPPLPPATLSEIATGITPIIRAWAQDHAAGGGKTHWLRLRLYVKRHALSLVCHIPAAMEDAMGLAVTLERTIATQYGQAVPVDAVAHCIRKPAAPLVNQAEMR